jgi:exodeoxyribonuclease VII small subunit
METPPDFETALAELERIVKQLEDGELPLEKSLELYERGVRLSRYCHGRLEDAEKRIEVLTGRGEVKTAPSALVAPSADEDDR